MRYDEHLQMNVTDDGTPVSQTAEAFAYSICQGAGDSVPKQDD